jgi:hypothetical protein
MQPIFAIAHVPNVVDPIFNQPMLSQQAQQVLRSGLGRCEAGDKGELLFLPRLRRTAALSASDPADLLDMPPALLVREISGQFPG